MSLLLFSLAGFIMELHLIYPTILYGIESVLTNRCSIWERQIETQTGFKSHLISIPNGIFTERNRMLGVEALEENYEGDLK